MIVFQLSSSIGASRTTSPKEAASPQTPKDDIDIFGENIVSKLRTIKSIRSRIIVQNNIDQLLFQAIMKEFPEESPMQHSGCVSSSAQVLQSASRLVSQPVQQAAPTSIIMYTAPDPSQVDNTSLQVAQSPSNLSVAQSPSNIQSPSSIQIAQSPSSMQLSQASNIQMSQSSASMQMSQSSSSMHLSQGASNLQAENTFFQSETPTIDTSSLNLTQDCLTVSESAENLLVDDNSQDALSNVLSQSLNYQ